MEADGGVSVLIILLGGLIGLSILFCVDFHPELSRLGA
jgi:hypothetical protein